MAMMSTALDAQAKTAHSQIMPENKALTPEQRKDLSKHVWREEINKSKNEGSVWTKNANLNQASCPHA